MPEAQRPPTGSFEDFLGDQHTAALRFAYLLTGGDQAAAEDVLQTALVRILAGGNWSQIRNPGGYLRAAVLNEWRTQAQRAGRYQPASVGTEPHTADSSQAAVERLWLWAALARLSDRQRAAVVLRYYADLDDTEAAALLGCSRATVRSLIHRALPKIQQALVDDTRTSAEPPGTRGTPRRRSHG